MVKTRSQRAVEARVLNDLHLAFKIDDIREAIFGHQGYDVVLLETRVNYEGKTDVERGTEMNHVYWSESMRTCWQSAEEPLELNNRTITKVSRKECFIGVVAREGNELEAILKELEISRFKRVASKDDKLARLNEIPDGPVDMATVSSTVVWNLAKRKAVKRGAAPRYVTSVSVDDNSKRRKVTSPTKSHEVLEESNKIAEGADLRPRFEVEAGYSVEHCRAKAQEKMVAVMDGDFKKFPRTQRDVQIGFQDRSMELEKRISQLEGEKNELKENLTRERGAFQLERNKESEAAALKLKEVRAESEAEAERLVTASAISQNNHAGKLYQLRYTKAEIMAFSERNNEEMEIMVEEEKELDVAREREEQTLLYNTEYAEEYEALNQLTSELAELKEKVAIGSRHEAKLAKYRIRALNEEISNITCNIRTRNEQLLKRAIELDTARTNLAVSEADFEKLSSSIVGKDRELCNSVQIRDSLVARLDRLKADLRHLKGREIQSRADLAEIQAKNQSLVDDLAHARGNMRRAMQREKEMNERINQLYRRISESERELRKSIYLTRQMSERINQLTAELAESKTHRLMDNKRAVVTHQAFKELVVYEQEKCDGEALHQRQLSTLVAFFIEEIKFLQIERNLKQDCFSGRTCVCKLNISSIDPIGVMDRGIGTTTAEQIARGREIVIERAPEYMASRTEIGGSSSVVSPTPVVGE
ncbi:hypothetical protein GIB67_008631, partial [Kingdonia uniflora]